MQQQWGSAWQQVYGDLVRDGKLPPELPGADGDREPDRPGRLRPHAGRGAEGRRHEQAGRPARQCESRTADPATAQPRPSTPFVRTAMASGQSRRGAGLADNVRQGSRTSPPGTRLDGDDPEKAVQRATDRILNDKYEIQGTMRVPRSVGLPRVMQAQAEIMRDLTPTTIADHPGRPGPDRQSDRRQTAWAGAAARGLGAERRRHRAWS